MLKYLLVMFITSSCSAAVSEVDLIARSIMFIEPAVSKTNATLIAHSINKYAIIHDLDWKIMAAILAQESSFRRDPQVTSRHPKGCLEVKSNCEDYGISQINFETWGSFYKLDKARLLADIDYNISIMSKILQKLKDKYGKEKTWATRYHSFSRSHRKMYADRIYIKYVKIHGYSKGFSDGKTVIKKRG